jgi:hypothetical protein
MDDLNFNGSLTVHAMSRSCRAAAFLVIRLKRSLFVEHLAQVSNVEVSARGLTSQPRS